jgi:hypothetical protein
MTDVHALTIADAPEEIATPIKEFWPEAEWDNAARISYLESSWKWDAEFDTTDPTHPCGTPIGSQAAVIITAEHSIGYFQINVCNFPTWNPCTLWNARQNAGTAHSLWSRSGWQPWHFSAKELGLLP